MINHLKWNPSKFHQRTICGRSEFRNFERRVEILIIEHQRDSCSIKKYQNGDLFDTLRIGHFSYLVLPVWNLVLNDLENISNLVSFIGEDHFGLHFWKWLGPHGSALRKAEGTTSECNSKCHRDHMGVHSEKGYGSRGSAFVSDRDQMGVHSKFLIGTTSECIFILI